MALKEEQIVGGAPNVMQEKRKESSVYLDKLLRKSNEATAPPAEWPLNKTWSLPVFCLKI